MKKIFYTCFMLCLLICGGFTLDAAPITVTNGNDAGPGSLRQAIADVGVADAISFAPGVTTVTLTSAELTINKTLSINAGSGVTITRSGVTEFRIFTISSGATVVFNKLTINNGKSSGQAGGIQNSGRLFLNDCTIANNQAPQGGGIQNDNTLTMNRCFVHSNITATSGSGLLIYGSSTTLNNCVFANNQGAYAIDLQANGTLTITNCTIAKNVGGGINIGNSSAAVTLKNTIVAENTTSSIYTNIRNIFPNNNFISNSTNNLIGTEGGNGGVTNGTNGNIVGVSPQFANSSDPDGTDNTFGTADDGLGLLPCSPAVNAGDNAATPSGFLDIATKTRTFGTTVDMGAYELQAVSTPNPTITLGTIPTILAGATSFTIPYTATMGSPTTYSIAGTDFTTVTDASLPSSPITVNLSAPASVNIDFTLTVKNASGCTSLTNSTGSVIVTTPITQACATATFTGTAPIAPTATTAGVGGRGGIYTYTVPAGVTAIRIDARGAKGGSTTFQGGSFNGGKGGRAVGTFAVTSGDVLHILVAGKGGDASSIAGGENPGQQRTAAGGGGATIVSNGPIGSGTLLLVGAGGGGAGRLGGGGTVFQSGGSGASGGSNIGAGGASVTANGANSITGDLVERDCGEGGKAATNGGNGGAAACANRLGTNGGGYGGGGAGNYSTPNGNAGGGGGAGYTGGNGGGTAGGNAGTNYVNPSATNGLSGETDLDAAVVINIAATVSYTGSPFCQSLTTTGTPTTTGYTGGTFSATPTGLTIDGTTGVINPSTSTAGTYTVSYSLPSGCTAITTTVTIQATTTPSVSISPTALCAGTSTTLTATGMNGGSSPQLTWTKNNVLVGTGNTLAVSNAVALDVYKVILVPSAEVCPSPAMAMASITVDNEKPIITCPPSQTIDLSSFECSQVVTFPDPSVSGNCSATFSRTDAFKATLKSGSSFGAGTYVLSYRATNLAGNFADCNFTIQVNGQLTTGRLKCLPTLTVNLNDNQCINALDARMLLIDNTYYCESFYNVKIPNKADNYITSADLGTTFTATVSDNFNNSCSTQVSVVDQTAPSIYCQQDTVVSCVEMNTLGNLLIKLKEPTIIKQCLKLENKKYEQEHRLACYNNGLKNYCNANSPRAFNRRSIFIYFRHYWRHS